MRVRGLGAKRRAPRPTLSPVLACLAASWASVLCATNAVLDAAAGASWLGRRPAVVLLAAFAACCVVLAVAAGMLRPARPAAILVAIGLLAGGAAGAFSTSSTIAAGEALVDGAVSSVAFTVETDPSSSAMGGWQCEASARREGAGAVRVRLVLPASGPAPVMGDVIGGVGRWSPLDPTQEYDRSLIARGVAAQATMVSWEPRGMQGGPLGVIRLLRSRLVGVAEPAESPLRALTCGVVCGMQAALDGFEVDADFSDLGLTHLVAVSGSHLVVVAGLFDLAIRRAHARPRARLAVEGVLLGCYVVLTGLQPSAGRALVMTLVAQGASMAGRRSHAVSSVGVAALAMVLASPSLASTMGFALSVLSVLGLTVFAGFARDWVACLLPGRAPEPLAEALSLTLVAQAFTMPVTLPAFGVLPLLSPLANVIAGPLVSALLVVGLVCLPLAAAVPALGQAALVPCDVLAAAACSVAHAMASLPGVAPVVDVGSATASLLLVAAAFALYAVWPVPSRRLAWGLLGGAALVGASVFLWGRFGSPARIVFLDVGQGDAVLVQDGPHALLVDTGPDDAVLYALARRHVYHLDAVLLTHTDSDHAGGVDDLVRRVSVDEVLVGCGVSGAIASDDAGLAEALDRLVGDDVGEVAQGDVLEVGGFELEVLWPSGAVDGADNEDSVVLFGSYAPAGGKERSLETLLTGDAEAEIVETLIEDDLVGRIDVLKVGHHGSRASTTDAMMDALDPLIAVASAGEGNRYGHPTEECVECIESHGTSFACTIECGDIEVRPEGGAIRVHYQKSAAQGAPRAREAL